MSIRIIAIGKKHQDWVNEGIKRYQSRLNRVFAIEWLVLKHSSANATLARRSESEAILSKLSDRDYVILLDEKGKMIDSPAFADLLLFNLEKSLPITIVIGGAYGVDQTLIDRANFVWSISNLVFPHQLVRLILVEQIYRAQEINSSKPYHHS